MLLPAFYSVHQVLEAVLPAYPRSWGAVLCWPVVLMPFTSSPVPLHFCLLLLEYLYSAWKCSGGCLECYSCLFLSPPLLYLHYLLPGRPLPPGAMLGGYCSSVMFVLCCDLKLCWRLRGVYAVPLM